VNTQFSLEPPDQGLCVGHGFVLEPVNDAFAVYNESGTRLTAPTALNQFYKRSPAIDRVTGVTGDFLSDPKCYWDPVGQRFIQTRTRFFVTAQTIQDRAAIIEAQSFALVFLVSCGRVERLHGLRSVA